MSSLPFQSQLSNIKSDKGISDSYVQGDQNRVNQMILAPILAFQQQQQQSDRNNNNSNNGNGNNLQGNPSKGMQQAANSQDFNSNNQISEFNIKAEPYNLGGAQQPIGSGGNTLLSNNNLSYDQYTPMSQTSPSRFRVSEEPLEFAQLAGPGNLTPVSRNNLSAQIITNQKNSIVPLSIKDSQQIRLNQQQQMMQQYQQQQLQLQQQQQQEKDDEETKRQIFELQFEEHRKRQLMRQQQNEEKQKQGLSEKTINVDEQPVKRTTNQAQPPQISINQWQQQQSPLPDPQQLLLKQQLQAQQQAQEEEQQQYLRQQQQQQLKQQQELQEQQERLQKKYQQEQQQQQSEKYFTQQLEAQRKQIQDQQKMLEQISKSLKDTQIQQQQQLLLLKDIPQSASRNNQSKGTESKGGNTLDDAQLEKRLQIIETNLNRVCNQHDSLIPLVSLVEIVPSLQKSESTIKSLSKKNLDLENRVKELEGQEKSDPQQHQLMFQNMDRNFQNSTNSIQQLRNDITKLEGNSLKQNDNAALIDQFNEDTLNLYKQVDNKLDKNIKDVMSLLAQFKNDITLENQRSQRQQQLQQSVKTKKSNIQDIDDDNINNTSRNNLIQLELQHLKPPQNLINDMNGEQQLKYNSSNQHERQFSLQSSGNNSRGQVDIDIANIYREIGILRTEMELLHSQKRSEAIQKELASIENTQSDDTQLAILGIEQYAYISEVEAYNNINQQRILYELDIINNKIQSINSDIKSNNYASEECSSNIQDESRMSSASQKMLIDEFKDKKKHSPSKERETSKSQLIGYELKFIADRLFCFKQQIHGTKKKYLCDCRRLEDKQQAIQILSDYISQSKQRQQQSNPRQSQVFKLKHRIDQVNNSISQNVSQLVSKLKLVENSYNKSKDVYQQQQQQQPQQVKQQQYYDNGQHTPSNKLFTLE